MPAYARKDIVEDGRVGAYHCMARCVRRAYLCGDDPVSGNNYEHRKGWIQEKLEWLAGIFAIDVCGYAVMSNHLHVIVRTRPDVATGWSTEEVARRWWKLFPKRRDENGAPAELEQHELNMLTCDGRVTEDRRRRLSNLSWFMRCLCEPIARRANREDKCTGRFWEGRFKSTALLDEAAILACSVYVDLNPVRSCLSQTPENSDFTSAKDRITARQARRVIRDKKQKLSGSNRATTSSESTRDGWLCPIRRERPSELAEKARRSASSTEAPPKTSPRRASSDSFLRIGLDEYLCILDWTGRQLRTDKPGVIPSELAPILDRLDINADVWTASIANFGRWFHRAAGSTKRLHAAAVSAGKSHLQGLTRCRDVFG